MSESASSTDNVLLVTARAPWPTNSGGQQRSFMLAEAIRKVARIHTLLIDPKPPPGRADVETMQSRFGLVESEPFVPRKDGRIRRLLNPGRSVLGVNEALAKYVHNVAIETGCRTVVYRYLPLAATSAAITPDRLRRLVDIDDVPSLRVQTEANQASGLRRLAKQWSAKSISTYQARALERLDGGWVSCADDLELVLDDRFSVLPNIPLAAYNESISDDSCKQEKDSLSVLFVGAMGYRINKLAMDWFTKHVWPGIRRSHPNARLRIAGGGLDEARQSQYAQLPGVDVLGFVADLAAEYARAALSVVPITAGAGTKIKVLESLLYGRTVVLTSHSLRGYESSLEDGRDLIVADDPEQMASSIARLLDSPDIRESMARSGQAIVRSEFGFERFASRVAEVLSG